MLRQTSLNLDHSVFDLHIDNISDKKNYSLTNLNLDRG